MNGRKGAWLDELTRPEAAARIAEGAPILLPVGAGAKAHGPHLALGTDRITARALADRVLHRLPLLAAPVLDLGYYPAFLNFPGSQHLSEPTFRAVLGEILDGFARHGSRRVAILNIGVSTEPPIDAVVAGRPGVLALHMRHLGLAARALLEVPDGGHADEAESSVMLALDPKSVRMAALGPAAPFTESAATGDSSRASAFKGERLLAARVDDIVDALQAAWPDLGNSGTM
ncbi:MAG: creatininase family protein [Alphaproteobacteria bacterium]|nr:creatininase family protein [Alphaproteobacteria bacterium]